MYNVSLAEKDDENAFDWALLTCVSILSVKHINTDFLKTWLLMTKKHLDQIEVGSPMIKEFLTKFTTRIDSLSDIDDELKETVESIRIKLYAIAYTPHRVQI